MSPTPVRPLGMSTDKLFEEKPVKVQVGRSVETRRIAIDFGTVVRRLYLTSKEARELARVLNAECADLSRDLKKTRKKRS